MADGVLLVPGRVADAECRRTGGGKGLAQPGQVQPVLGLDALVVGGILEFQGQNTEVDEVLPVNTGVGLGDDGSQVRGNAV
ncbi:hypothetical protein SANTM175S_06846 [Streptomyces antimycoticus]